MNLSKHINKYKGKRGFVIGGGYSIKEYREKGFDFSLLDNEITVGANKAYKVCKVKFLIFLDFKFYQQYKEEINKLDCIKLAPSWAERLQDFKGREDTFIFKNCTANYLPTTFNCIRTANNSGVVALRIAYLLGLNPIYLVGIDLVKEHFGTDKMHFHDDYPESWVKSIKKKICDFFITEFVRTIEALKEKGIQVYSCYERSGLNEYIPYVNLFDLFKEKK